MKSENLLDFSLREFLCALAALREEKRMGQKAESGGRRDEGRGLDISPLKALKGLHFLMKSLQRIAGLALFDETLATHCKTGIFLMKPLQRIARLALFDEVLATHCKATILGPQIIYTRRVTIYRSKISLPLMSTSD